MRRKAQIVNHLPYQPPLAGLLANALSGEVLNYIFRITRDAGKTS